jgi:ABC-type transport system substrate-binding protein
MVSFYKGALVVLLICLSTIVQAQWNNPYPLHAAGKNVMYTSFSERPKTLDPARSYSSNEYVFVAQIYEPPFQYHYLKRPYVLEPLTAVKVPTPIYLDKHYRLLPGKPGKNKIAFSVYRVQIKKGIYYQPHPAFAKDENGKLLYENLSANELASINDLNGFSQKDTRELLASDYVYQIKRLAMPSLHSPIFGLMSQYIVGLKDLYTQIQKEKTAGVISDLEKLKLSGVKVVDKYTYEIKIKGKYPQFIFWMAMPFFAPMPPEADKFFSQTGMKKKNLTLDWYAIGTGAYMLTVNDPNQKMVMQRNPNYHQERYPASGMAADKENGLLADAGQLLPFIDKFVFSLEKEGIPRWNKFLQGYYDRSGIGTEAFDQAVQFSIGGNTEVTKEMKGQGIQLSTSVATSIQYFGFNMMDAVVGGYTMRARKLRQAISIAINFEEYISIFNNGRGLVAQGPIPPGIFGALDGKNNVNNFTYDWVENKARRKDIAYAKKLMREAGYPNGRDLKSGKPLLLYYDTTGTSPEAKSRLGWMRKQFKKINIDLVIRNTDYNRFQEKMLKGTAQMYWWGWNADYPDPENFLFLLYGPNKKVGLNGENASNYDNPEFNRLFDQMKDMDNGPARQKLINAMLEIVRRDSPWAWGYFPKDFSLQHAWVKNRKANLMANNTLKYLRLEPELRENMREKWNQPVIWPSLVTILLIFICIIPAVLLYRRHERQAAL